MDSFEELLAQRARVLWRVKERDPATGLWVPTMARRNKLTDFGLTNLAKSWAGAGTPPLYLIIDSYKGAVKDSIPAGAVSVTVTVPAGSQVHKAGDTRIVLDVGGINQEAVAFSGAANNGNGSWTYSLSTPATLPHSAGQWVSREAKQADTLADIKSEVQYDAVVAPNVRMKASGIGYSQGVGNYVMQFFLTGTQALTSWVALGLSDTGTVGQGQLHNHVLFGYDHQAGNDVELDVSLTLKNEE